MTKQIKVIDMDEIVHEVYYCGTGKNDFCFEGTEDECIDYICNTVKVTQAVQTDYIITSTDRHIVTPIFKKGDIILHKNNHGTTFSRIITNVTKIGYYYWKYAMNKKGGENYSKTSDPSDPYFRSYIKIDEVKHDKQTVEPETVILKINTYLRLTTPYGCFDKDFIDKIQDLGFQVTFISPLNKVTKYNLFCQEVMKDTVVKIMICSDDEEESNKITPYGYDIIHANSKEDFLHKAFILSDRFK